jgi:hypothetical protein
MMRVAIVLLITSISAQSISHHYQAHDHVPVVANTVGPFNNPTETYPVRIILGHKISTRLNNNQPLRKFDWNL